MTSVMLRSSAEGLRSVFVNVTVRRALTQLSCVALLRCVPYMTIPHNGGESGAATMPLVPFETYPSASPLLQFFVIVHVAVRMLFGTGKLMMFSLGWSACGPVPPAAA